MQTIAHEMSYRCSYTSPEVEIDDEVIVNYYYRHEIGRSTFAKMIHIII